MKALAAILLTISPFLVAADKGPNFGLDICDAECSQTFCQFEVNVGVIYDPKLALGYAAIQTACKNMAGPARGYVHNERRSNCLQTTDSTGKQYKFDFNIQRIDGSMFSTNLDVGTCVATMQTILSGGACRTDKGSTNLGGRLGAGLFMLAAVPNPGQCAGTKPLK